MAERRTKEEKEQAHLRRVAELNYSLTNNADSDQPDDFAWSNQDDSTQTKTNLLAYSLELIKKDLLRTSLSTALVFLILVALYLIF